MGQAQPTPVVWFELSPNKFAIYIEDHLFYQDDEAISTYVYFSSFAIYGMEWNRRYVPIFTQVDQTTNPYADYLCADQKD